MLDTSPIRRVALGDQVADRLRMLIIGGQLPAGHLLVESALSSEFDVSRGPIRDALTRLQAEGLVAARGRSLAVVGMSADDVDELYSLRQALESLALTRLVELDDLDLEPLQGPLERMERSAAAGDAATYAVADLDFHTEFYRLARHRRLMNVWSDYRPAFAAMLHLSTSQDHDLGPSLDSHRRIAELLAARDLDGALEELRTHLRDANQRLRAAQASATPRQIET